MRSRRKRGEKFARVPRRVLESAACIKLPHAVFRLLVAYAAQFNGHNNGSLAVTREQARRLGITRSADTLHRGQKLLEEHGLIRLTKRGTRTPPVPHLYALTWEGVDSGKHDANASPVPSREFERWIPRESDCDVRSSDTAMSAHRTRDDNLEASTMSAHRTRSADFDVRSSDTSKNLAIAVGRNAHSERSGPPPRRRARASS